MIKVVFFRNKYANDLYTTNGMYVAGFLPLGGRISVKIPNTVPTDKYYDVVWEVSVNGKLETVLLKSYMVSETPDGNRPLTPDPDDVTQMSVSQIRQVVLYDPTGSEIFTMTQSKNYEAFKQLQQFILDFSQNRIMAGLQQVIRLSDFAMPAAMSSATTAYTNDCGSYENIINARIIAQGLSQNGKPAGVIISIVGDREQLKGYTYNTSVYLFFDSSLNPYGAQGINVRDGLRQLVQQVFSRMLPYQQCGTVIAVENITRIQGETEEQKRQRELAIIQKAIEEAKIQQEALAQRQYEERLIAEKQRQAQEQLFNIQQQEQLRRRQEEEARRLIESARTVQNQAAQTQQLELQRLQAQQEQVAQAKLQQEAIAKARQEALEKEKARMAVLTNPIPTNTRIDVGKTDVIERLGTSKAFETTKDFFSNSDADALTLDADKGVWIDQEGNEYKPEDVKEVTDKNGIKKVVPKKKWYQLWWVWLIIVLLFGGIGFAVWYYYQKQDKK